MAKPQPFVNELHLSISDSIRLNTFVTELLSESTHSTVSWLLSFMFVSSSYFKYLTTRFVYCFEQVLYGE